MNDEHRDIAMGVKYPYHGKPPKDWAEVAALGILRDLSDRRGIKHELGNVDGDIKAEIVEKMAAIIRAAAPLPHDIGDCS
jgi:hypothetical protein